MKRIEQVTVIGAGTMGRQIAVQIARSGIPVSIYESNAEAALWAGIHQRDEVAAQVEAGELTRDEADALFGRIAWGVSLGIAVQNADLVIEVVPERIDLKRTVWTQMDEYAPDTAILATNSSSVRVSLLEDATGRPDRVANLHFFHPLRDRLMVEVGPGTQTSNETMDALMTFGRRIGLLPLRVQRESTGFIINRVWRAIKKESLRVAEDGVASVEDIDRAFMIFFDVPKGPFATMDEIGLDVIADIERNYAAESGDPRDLPPPILTDLIEKGALGKKNNRGFYTYPDPAYAAPDFLTPATQTDNEPSDEPEKE